MRNLFFPSIIVALVAFAIVLKIFASRKEKERTLALQQVAGSLGWSFAAEAPWNMIAGLERFVLFNQGHAREIRNFMYGEAKGVKAAIFDYIYVTGSGKSQHVYHQSVVYLEPGNMNVPGFSLRPEGFLHKMLSALGYQDIDFGQRPGFSEQYILRGQDEMTIRRTFDDRVLGFFENYPGTCVDALGNQLFIYRAGCRGQPEDVESHVGLGLQLTSLLSRW